LLEAAAFAARAHRGQLRKDRETPYVSHVFRVCLVLCRVFEVTDPRVLTAALLHDTLEDTLTDFDDLEQQFGEEIAGWVAALSKDKRQREQGREKAYLEQLLKAPWQVQMCKLADVFDNALDLANLPPERQERSLRRAESYLTALASSQHEALRQPLALTRQLVEEVRARVSKLPKS
jgi:guanosine-3',5'-bis(diphosphate) 3'-pyrophosphohydrolase